MDWERKSSEVRYDPPVPVVLWANETAKLILKFNWSVPNPGTLTHAKIEQSSYLEIEWSTPQAVETFATLAHQILQLLSTGIHETVSISDLRGRTPEHKQEYGSGKTTLIPVAIYYSDIMHAERAPKIAAHRMIFRLENFKGGTQATFDAWFSIHPKIVPSLNLYFSARTDPHRYLTVRFLFIVQALETFHRRTSNETQMPEEDFIELKKTIRNALPKAAWDYLSGRLAYGNEPGLAKRLRSLFEPFGQHFGSADQVLEFIRVVVDTRNYFTHYDIRLEARSADGVALWTLCEKLEVLFQLHLLRLVGFTAAEIGELVGKHPDMGRGLAGSLPIAPTSPI